MVGRQLYHLGKHRMAGAHQMQVGDLVIHNNQRWVGVITHREPSRVGTMYRIDWTDGAKGVCWEEEIKAAKCKSET